MSKYLIGERPPEYYKLSHVYESIVNSIEFQFSALASDNTEFEKYRMRPNAKTLYVERQQEWLQRRYNSLTTIEDGLKQIPSLVESILNLLEYRHLQTIANDNKELCKWLDHIEFLAKLKIKSTPAQ